MTNARGKSIDNTHLSIDAAEARGFIHRDYIAHCLRWTHVCRYLYRRQAYQTARILDIGCGREVPLAKLLYSSRLIPERYAGIDVNTLTMPSMFLKGKFQPDLYTGDFCDLELEDLEFTPNIIVCFEVLEHIEPEHVVRMLKHTRYLLDGDGVAFFSTPCWNPDVGAAANHVNEMRYEAMGSILEKHSFRIVAKYGTFASIKDYKHKLAEDGGTELFERLRDYYDTNYLATIFAPLYPHLARNVLWQVDKHTTGFDQFESLESVEQPWTSSEHWRDLDG